MEDHFGNLRPPLSFGRRLALVVGIVVASVALDQWTKVLAYQHLRFAAARIYLGDLFRFQYSENPGAFLSLGATMPDVLRYGVFTVGVGLLLIGILVYAVRGRDLNALQVTGYALIVGGGLSNWLDRAFRSGARVIDFMNMGIGSLRTGIFNVADLAVVVGLVLIVLVPRRTVRQAPPESSSSAQ